VLPHAILVLSALAPGIPQPGTGAAAVPTGDVTPVTELLSAHSYRSGLLLGFSFGAGIGGASGYPNNAGDIGNSADYSSSGWMTGTCESVFLMGALSDSISFGFLFAHDRFRNSTFYSNGDGVGVRLEVYPLVTLVPRLQGLGVLGQFGLGTGDLVSKPPGLPDSQGTQSFAGVGVFQEWAVGTMRGGAHIGVGPSLEYDAIWSQPFQSHGLVATLRLAFYTGR
jgi:hypothetical protein